MTTASNIALGLTVVDLGMGMAAALVAKQLADSGATVIRVEPEHGDPFDAVYPAHRSWRARCQKAPLTDLGRLLGRADVCILGGEAFPGLEWKFDAQTLAESHPQLIVTELAGYASAANAGAPAVDLLVQARTGLVWEHFADRPVSFAMPLPTYGAAMLALVGTWAALLARQSIGRGQLVRTSMQQGIGLFWAPLWMSAERPDSEFNKVSPKGVRHLIFQCADNGWIQFVMGVPGAVAKLYRVLGIDVTVDPNDRGNPKAGASLEQYFGDRPLIAPYVRKRQRSELLQAAWDEGLAAEAVLAPGEGWSEPQVVQNRILEQHESGLQGVGLCTRALSIAGDVPFDGPKFPPRGAGGDQRPLAGVRIIDMGSFVAGPFASKVLAGLGADVIKVEALTGSAGRGIVRHTVAADGGKRSIAIDMKTLDGMEIVRRLCATADATHHNFRVGVAGRLGVDPDSLRRLKSDMVTLETSAYGSIGPKAKSPGFDMVMQALCGHEIRAGGVSNPPMWMRAPLVDYATGAMGAVALMMGLFARRTNGHAAETEVSLLDTSLFLMSELIKTAEGDFVGAPLLNTEQTGFHPAEALYKARDGWIAIAARDDAMAARLALVLELDALGARADWGGAVQHAISERIVNQDCATWLAKFGAAEIWAERCVEDGWSALCADPDARVAGLLVDLSDARYGQITGFLGPLVQFSRTSIDPLQLKVAPGLGEHSRQLLVELGYEEGEIEELFQKRVVA